MWLACVYLVFTTAAFKIREYKRAGWWLLCMYVSWEILDLNYM